tara:strand:+ start:281 stop:511 length:231 start_codon:yes stop_codon:yes gene_type:complete
MPYGIRKMPNRACYKVFNKNTKKVFAKCTTMEKAQKQLRLLRGLKNNPKFRSKFKRSTMKKTGGKTRKTRKTSRKL